jgi:hypothetical protein
LIAFHSPSRTVRNASILAGRGDEYTIGCSKNARRTDGALRDFRDGGLRRGGAITAGRVAIGRSLLTAAAIGLPARGIVTTAATTGRRVTGDKRLTFVSTYL